ncbi:hypothetical protein AWR27_15280 [Spirosoma montaniterrae]|uniref:IPT/TIG domain-containing protein n=1 Tax=Spirosoma montaniterrae TaxID=1178516 RepID=A0A1P9WYX8_9BACT|nr:hypothetical protein AWR27_15280 [Spirosoma montaniterrae]
MPDLQDAVVVPGSGSEPAILEATVDGVGKAFISGRSIIIKLPADYKEPNVRITYKVSEGVRVLDPRSGALYPVKANPLPRVCVQKDELGNCKLYYEIVIETPSPLKFTPDSALALTIKEYYQPFRFLFTVDNLDAGMPAQRYFSVRFVNNTTQETFTSENYMVNALNGEPVYVNAPNQNIPKIAKLQLTGSLPVNITAGEYTLTIRSRVEQTIVPGQNSLAGIESVDFPLTIKAGPPIIGLVSPSAPATGVIAISGRNLEPAKRVVVRLTNDFTQTLEGNAAILNTTVAQLALPAIQPSGQYLLDVIPQDGKPYRSLFTIPNARSSQSFAYVGPPKSYTASFDWMPALPAFKGGEALAVRYSFTIGDLSYSTLTTRTVKAVRIISVANPNMVYELTNLGSFRPFALATDFNLWRWKLPDAPQKGDYKLVFEDFDGSVSLPFYRKIRIE